MSSEVHFQEWARQGRCVLQALRWGLCTVTCLACTKFGAVRPPSPWHRAGLATAPSSAEVLDKMLYGRNQFSHGF